MPIRYSVAVRNAKLDAIDRTIGHYAVLMIRTGPPPPSLFHEDSGDVLSAMELPFDWMAKASSGIKEKAGTWQDNTAEASGTPGHFRVYASDGTPHIQGTVGMSNADMIVNAPEFKVGQVFTVTTFTIVDNNG